MRTLLALLGLLTLAFVGTRLSRLWARQRSPASLLVVTGGGYLLLGVLLGRFGLGLLSPTVLQQLQPLVGFALGWLGVLIGAQFRRPFVARLPGRLYLVAAATALPPALAVGIGAWSLARLWPALAVNGAAVVVLAAGATVLSPATLGFVRRLSPSSRGLDLLLALSGLVDLVPVVVALVLSAVVLVQETAMGWPACLLLIGALGGAGGVALGILLGQTAPRRHQILILLGVVTLGAGLATYFRLSPLGLSFLAGVLFVNLGRRTRSWSVDALRNFERPIYMGLLLVAGASVSSAPWVATGVAVALYLLLRSAGISVAGWIVGRLRNDLPLPSSGITWALLPQGAVGLALLLEGLLLYPERLPQVLPAALVMGFLLFDLFAPVAVPRLAATGGERPPT